MSEYAAEFTGETPPLPEDLHAGLNKEQIQAVRATEGPVIVVAGAGAGKTKTLIHRAGELLRKGVPPVNLLLVTFTNDAAQEIRSRLYDIAGPDAEHITAGTFHSVIYRHVLRAFPESRTLQDLGIDMTECSILDDGDATKLLREALQELGDGDVHAVQDNDWGLKHFEKEMTLARANGQDVDDYEARIRPGSKKELFRRIVARAWRIYQHKCRQANGIDFDDILIVADKMLRQEPKYAEELGSRFQYIMLDEYQDTNRVQMNVMDAIASTHRNIFVVGDEKQSIYRFRGADIQVILSFKHRYPEAQQIDMIRNYRSSQNVIDCGNALARKMRQKLSNGQLVAEGKVVGRPPVAMVFPNAHSEAETVRRAIMRDLHRGLPPEEIAVLYRNRSRKAEIERALVEHSVPYQVVGDTSFYQRQEVRDAIALLRFLFHPWDSMAGLRVLKATTMGVSDANAKKAMQQAGTTVRGFLEEQAQKRLKTARGSGEAPLSKAAQKVRPFVEIGAALRESLSYADPAEDVVQIIEKMWNLYFLPKLRRSALKAGGEDAASNLEGRVSNVHFVLQRFQQALEQKHPIDDVIDELAMAASSQQQYDQEEGGRVKLMTIHASKGLEFTRVYLVGADDKVLPGIDEPDEVEESLRLFYVAVTRAKQAVVVTCSERFMENGTFVEVEPSRFFEHLRNVPEISIQHFHDAQAQRQSRGEPSPA